MATAFLKPPKIISFTPVSDSLDLINAPILFDSNDSRAVNIAVDSLSDDFRKVTGTAADVVSFDENASFALGAAIIVGSVDSSLVKKIVDKGKLDAARILGKWESFLTEVVDEPLEGVQRALVVAGSDRRGTVFGIYEVSQQIGVSPWYWWADVPVKHQEKIHALPVKTTQGEPSVKYRGLFINDESPSLNSWVHEKIGSVYNAEFYKHVFELLLRLKANYLWPAMWPAYPPPGNSFFTDDPINQRTADEYGIVMSTSHHEPMQRATNEWIVSGQGAWNWEKNKGRIYPFFKGGAERAKGFESYFTIGMRGEGDVSLVADDPMAVLKDVISSQREIIAGVYGKEEGVRQVWALYKEVQALYEAGLEVPDDVTLLFADDNFGNIRRLPMGNETERAGGSGVYYHCEFVGPPRSYKWHNTNQLAKIWDQLNTARLRGAHQIWVINVADIKPMELPLTFIMQLAWNASSLPLNSIPDFLESWAAREFTPQYAKEIASLQIAHQRLISLRKHENIEPDTFSLVNYNEADKILQEWENLTIRAEAIYETLPEVYRPAFFQLVLHPVKASYILTDVKVSLGKNNLYGLQRRNSANRLAKYVLERFDNDYDLQLEYHSMLEGKWNHIMAQSHYGFQKTWHPPIRDMISGLSYVQTRQNSVPAVGQMGVIAEGTAGVRPGLWNEGSDLAKPLRGELRPTVTLPPMDPYGPEIRYVELYCRGVVEEIEWSAKTSHDWIKVQPESGTLRKDLDQRVTIAVSWEDVPEGFNGDATVYLNSTIGDYEEVSVPVNKTTVPTSFKGFIESDGHVSMEASHFSTLSESSNNGTRYEVLRNYGRTLSGVAIFPVTAASQILPDAAYLEYDLYLFSTPEDVTVTLYFSPSLSTNPARPLAYALALDDGTPVKTLLSAAPATAGDLPSGWTDAVQDNIWKRSHTLKNSGGTGPRKFRYWALEPGIILQKIVVDLGGVRSSYLGPPESFRQ